MKEYQSFIFDSYTYAPAEGTIELRYNLDGEFPFTEKISLPADLTPRVPADSPVLREALFALHLIGGISYYKTCLPKQIIVKSGELNADQAAFWNTVYKQGLGEFFFKNKIDFRKLINFPSSNKSKTPIRQKKLLQEEKRVLVPVGGGKDSVVTIELLKKAGFTCVLFRMGSHPVIEEIAKTAGLPMMIVERRLSPNLFTLNEEGALNGHVPISAYLSALTAVIAILYGFDAIAMSNERSANFGNVLYLGKEMNHQWSKSEEFEKMFSKYLAMYVDPSLEYFSALRPLSELHIAKLFAQYPQYFPCTTSCNKNWRIDKERPSNLYCGECPKCAFVFAMLAAFVPKETLIGMFHKNLFADTSLLPLYWELWGIEGFKPFECVGTPEETIAAFLLARERREWEGDAVMQIFEKDVFPLQKDPIGLIHNALTPQKKKDNPYLAPLQY